MLNAIKISLPTLEGTARKIAYIIKKYHSGLMWVGVDIGLAFFIFSVSGTKV